MPTPLTHALLFLIDTLFGLYAFILMLRLMLGCINANYFDPFVQFIVRLTRGIIHPIRSILPNYKQFELSTLLVLFLLVYVKFVLLFSLRGFAFNLISVAALTTAELIGLVIYIYFFALIAQMIMGWVGAYNSLFQLLQQLTYPILRPIQRILPPIGGIDLSPIPAVIIMQLVIILLVTPLREWAMSLMM